jgi:hypothetical protein
MTILETLQTDHRQVKVLLDTILSTNDAKKRGGLFIAVSLSSAHDPGQPAYR